MISNRKIIAASTFVSGTRPSSVQLEKFVDESKNRNRSEKSCKQFCRATHLVFFHWPFRHTDDRIDRFRMRQQRRRGEMKRKSPQRSLRDSAKALTSAHSSVLSNRESRFAHTLARWPIRPRRYLHSDDWCAPSFGRRDDINQKTALLYAPTPFFSPPPLSVRAAFFFLL